jgi:hypothetical protein
MFTNSSEYATQEKNKKKITRRDFLKLSGAIGTETALLSIIPFGKVFADNNSNNTSINHIVNTNAINKSALF